MLNLLSTAAEYSNTFVVLMGVGTVFAGLILIIFCCYIMGALMKDKKAETTASVSPAQVTSAPVAPIENKQEVVAAISAAVAENLGRDVSAIRIVSIKKV